MPKIVPDEITPEMERAARMAMFQGTAAMYRAMLAAAPEVAPRRADDTKRLDWLETRRYPIFHGVPGDQVANGWILEVDQPTLRKAIDAEMSK